MDSTHRPSATAPVAMASPERTGSMPVTYVDSSNVEAFGNDLDFRVTHAVFVEAPTRIGRVLHLLTELPVSDPSAGDDAAAPPSSSKRSSWGGSEPVVFALDEASSEEASVAGSPPEPIATAADGNNSDSGESSTGSVTADHARLTLAARTIDEALVNEVMSVWDDERSAERSAVLVRGRRAAVAAAKEDPSLAAVRGDIYQELCTLRTNLQMFSMYWNSRFPYDAHFTAVQDLGMRLKPLACDALEQASAYIDAHDRYSGLWTTAAEEIYDALALDPTPVLDRLHSAEINMAHRLTVHIHFICGTYAQLHRLVTEGLGDFVPKHDLLGATADAVVRAQADAAAAAAAAAETGSKGRKRRSVSPGRRATEGKAMQAARSAPTSSSFSSTMNYFTQP